MPHDERLIAHGEECREWGGRSLAELMYGVFIGRAGDEIFNQMAK